MSPLVGSRITRRQFLAHMGGFGLAVGSGFGLAHWANTDLTLTQTDIALEQLPPAFDGLRVVQLSDLHGAEFGTNNGPVVDMVRGARPDLIVCTGDMVDGARGGEAVALALVEQLVKIAPVYCVLGNHEWARGSADYMVARMRLLGATVLLDEAIALERTLAGTGEKQSLWIAGLSEYRNQFSIPAAGRLMLRRTLEQVPPGAPLLLLAHRPQHADIYAGGGVMLALTGHNHGGQFRVPGVGGMLSPEMTFFPPFDAGLFRVDGMAMYVHRSLGNSAIPVRIMNSPEVALLTLTRLAGAK